MGNTNTVGDDAKLSTGAAARRLSISGETLRRYAALGLIKPDVLPSGRLRWRATDLDAIGRAS